MQADLSEYQSFRHSHYIEKRISIEHTVYEKGDGPPIVLMQELPGIGRETLRLSEQFIEQGFTVYLPHLFGPLGKTRVVGNLLRVLCMRREFSLFQQGQSSPITDWLRSLIHIINQRHIDHKVGVIGMCLTGNFAISMLTESCVTAAVAAQPSLPILAPSDLHMSEEELLKISERLEHLEPVQLYRFEGDSLCSAQKAQAFENRLNVKGKKKILIHTLPGNQHSVFTLDFVDEKGHPTRAALDEVLCYFKRVLQPK